MQSDARTVRRCRAAIRQNAKSLYMISRCLRAARPSQARPGQQANTIRGKWPMGQTVVDGKHTKRMSFRYSGWNRFGHKLVGWLALCTCATPNRYRCMFINFNWFPVSNIFGDTAATELCWCVDGLEKRNRMHLQKNLILNHTFFLRRFYFLVFTANNLYIYML